MADPATPDPSAAPAPRPKTQAELQAEIAETRERLASTLEELRVQTQPANLAKRGTDSVKGFFTDEFGGIRPDRVVMVGATVVGLVLFRRWRRSRRRCHCH